MTVACLQIPCCDCSSIAIPQVWKPKRTTLCIFLSYQAESLKVRRSTWRSWGSHESSRASTSAKLPTRLPQQTSSKSGSLWTVSTPQLGQGSGESFAHGQGLLQDKQRSLSGFGLYNLKGRAPRKLSAIRHLPQGTVCALNLVMYKKRLGEVVVQRDGERGRERKKSSELPPSLPSETLAMPCFHSLIFGWTVAWREASPRQQGEIREGSAGSEQTHACLHPDISAVPTRPSQPGDTGQRHVLMTGCKKLNFYSGFRSLV